MWSFAGRISLAAKAACTLCMFSFLLFGSLGWIQGISLAFGHLLDAMIG